VESKTYIDTLSLGRRVLLIGTWVVCSLIGFATVGAWLGLTFAGAGAVIFGVYQWMAKTQAITCDESGLTVTATSRRAGTTTTSVTWPEVTTTRYYEQVVEGDESDITTRHFTVQAGTRTVLQISNASRSFALVIAAVCDHTGHLDYRWVPRKEARKDEILESAGDYVKIRRQSMA
jgi:hypothetical protein